MEFKKNNKESLSSRSWEKGLKEGLSLLGYKRRANIKQKSIVRI